ncbi:MAG: tetratricopeptide repeat protein, partial [Candidatus Heimdallarchaeota archaeon]|nr:tetratricopeptide repeat protein [Candidatus Heimdallarchaeota archaeon]
ILVESLRGEEQDEEILFYTRTMFNESMDFLKNHLVELIGIEEELEWQKFMEFKFDAEEEKILQDLITMVADVLREGKVEFSKVESLNFFGTMAQKFEMIEETIVFYVAVVGKDQENLVAIYNLGLLYAKIGNMDEAIQQFTNILQFEPNNANALSKLGDIYLHRKNDFQLAADYYKQVLETNNEDITTGLKLTAALSKLENFDEAISVIIKLLSVEDTNPDLWLNYAVLLVKQVQFEEALDAYNKALDIAPKDWDFREKAENEKTRVEQIINAPEYTEADDESLHYMVDEERKIKLSKVFIFAQDPVDDEVFMAIFDWFKQSKEKYNVPADLVPKYGSIIDQEQFPLDPLRAQGFAEVVFKEQFEIELDLSKFHHELYDLEGYGKIIVFMEEDI